MCEASRPLLMLDADPVQVSCHMANRHGRGYPQCVPVERSLREHSVDCVCVHLAVSRPRRPGYSRSCELLYRVFTVFAFAVDLGTIQSTSDPVTWSVGYVRDPSITYTQPSGAIQQRRPYYATQYSTINSVVSADCYVSIRPQRPDSVRCIL